MIAVVFNRILPQVKATCSSVVPTKNYSDKESTYTEEGFIGDDITCHVTYVRTIELPKFQLLKQKIEVFGSPLLVPFYFSPEEAGLCQLFVGGVWATARAMSHSRSERRFRYTTACESANPPILNTVTTLRSARRQTVRVKSR